MPQGRLSRRRLLIAGGTVTGGVLLGACGPSGNGASGGTAASTAPTSAGVMSSMTVGINNPNYASQLPIFIAAEKGYFADVGIEDFDAISTDEYVPGLIGGSLNVTQGDTDVLLGSAMTSNEPIRFLGTYRNREWRNLGVGPGIETFEDLRGQTLSGGQTGSRNEFLMKQILADNGLDPERDVRFVPQGGQSDAQLQAVLNGQLQGAALFPRHEVALTEAGGKFLYSEIFDVPQEGVAAMAPFIADNAATVVAYLTATIGARQYMKDLANQDEVIALMRDNDFEIPEEFEAVYQAEVDQISADAGFEPGDMDDLVAEQIELGFLPEGLEWRQYVDLEPLWAAQEANDLPRRPERL